MSSKAFVAEQFSWSWHYYFLTNEGIEYLRQAIPKSHGSGPSQLFFYVCNNLGIWDSHDSYGTKLNFLLVCPKYIGKTIIHFMSMLAFSASFTHSPYGLDIVDLSCFQTLHSCFVNAGKSAMFVDSPHKHHAELV